MLHGLRGELAESESISSVRSRMPRRQRMPLPITRAGTPSTTSASVATGPSAVNTGSITTSRTTVAGDVLGTDRRSGRSRFANFPSVSFRRRFPRGESPRLR